MPLDTQRERARQRAITKPETRRTTQATRTEDLPAAGGGGGWRPAIVRSISTTAQSISFQLLDYAETPPVVGNYVTFGVVLTGYPFPTFTAEHFSGHQLASGEAITQSARPVLVKKNRKGDWLVMDVLKTGAVSTDGTYVFGGDSPQCFGTGQPISDNDQYRVDFWIKRAPLSCPNRRLHSGVAVGQELFSFGGLKSGIGGTLRDAAKYVPDHWSFLTPMRNPGRREMFAFAIDGFPYVAGGRFVSGDANENVTPQTDRYDPAANTWRGQDQMSLGSRSGASFSADGAGFAVAGASQSLNFHRVVQRFDSGGWSRVQELEGSARSNFAGFSINDMGFVVGGTMVNSQFSDLTARYDPVGDRWRGDPPRRLGFARFSHTAASLGGKGYVHGGEALFLQGGETYITEEFDPANETWRSNIAQMSMPTRAEAAAGTIV